MSLKVSFRSAGGESAIRGIDYTVSNILWDHKKSNKHHINSRKDARLPLLPYPFLFLLTNSC